MRSLVVLLAVVAVARGSLFGLVAQPPHHPAVVLDPHGRPLDTAEVIGARALHLQAKALEHHDGHLVAPIAHSVVAPVAHAVVAAPAAVSHQSRIDVHSSPVVVNTHAASLWGASPLGHGHWLKKRSLDLLEHSAPLVYSHAIATPLVHATPIVKYVGGSAVSHQSRVDVHSSPAVVSHSVVAPVVSHAVVAAPVVSAHSAWATPAITAHGLGLAGHGHLLKKRSLALAHALPAVSHQSRVDVISSHAAPVAVSHAAPITVAHVAPIALAHAPAVSHQSRVDVISSHSAPIAVAHAAPISVAYTAPVAIAHAPAVSHQSRVDVISPDAHLAPLTHSTTWTAPAHLAHSGLLHDSHW